MATIHDVAAMAGVSVTTVSRVLNNRGYISEETRQKVFKCMDEIGYQPNEIARSLLKKQSNLIGLIIPTVSHPFFGELAAAVEAHAYQHGFKLLLCNSKLDPVKERDYLEMMRRNRVDGIIMGSHTLEVESYRQLQHPLVTLERRISADIPYVASDNAQGGELAARLLLERGCTRIAHICGNLELDLLAGQRTEAFLQVLRGQGMEPLVIQTDMNVFEQSQYEHLLVRLLQEHPEVDGIFATSDIIAAFAVKVCRAMGRAVPGEVRIVGYDDINPASWMSPALTTIRQPIGEMGRLAVDLIRQQLEGGELQREHVLPVSLVERETT